jgi:hypothetical protein
MSNRIAFSGMLLFTAACVTQVLNAQATLVCSGTRLNGTPFTFPFVANTSPAPTLGAACVPSGKTMPKGKAVMGTAPKASQVSAVVLVPPSTAGGKPNANQQPNSSPPAAAPAGTTPSMIATGIFNLQTALSNLATAGNNWGPHLVNALKDINQALDACGVTPPPPSTMTSQPWANTTLMTLGIQRVTKAQTEFKNAKDPWGGRRDKALPFITQALTELQAANKLASGLSTMSNTPSANPPGPPMIADGIANLQNARSNLEMAGPNWGPHLANAINYIDQALDVCGVTTPDSGIAKSVTTDLPSMMTTGTQQVTKAQTDFKNAKDPWGGRRDKTLPFITQALKELQLAATAGTAP